MLLVQKAYLAKYDSEAYNESLAAGETLLAHGWSGELFAVQSMNPDVGFVVPKEGSFLVVDNLVVPKSSKHQYTAEVFINYLLRPEVAAKNTNAVEMLKRLEQGPVTVDAKVFDTYVGEYELGPGFIMRVFREGDKFMTQATNQPAVEIVAESETTFFPRAFRAKLTFLKGADGKVTSMRLIQGGREVTAKKIK